MTKTTKLDTLKALVARWDRTRGVVDAWEVCEFLKENLQLSEEAKQ